jgi:hypothetical protein
MKVNIADHHGTIQWSGIYYFGLSSFPSISDWELTKLVHLDMYENSYGRKIEIECENEEILQRVTHALAQPEPYRNIPPPPKITECTACRFKCCLTDYVCHTAIIENARSIITTGKLLSAVKAFNKTAVELVLDARNAAGDTPDYFDYIMFAWGNCQAGDRLVMERLLHKPPDERDLSENFTPGVRFYFKHSDLLKHPAFVFDGYHPAKIKDELEIFPCLQACIIPEEHSPLFEPIIPDFLSDKVFYVKNDGKDIWEWSEKVYNLVTQRL